MNFVFKPKIKNIILLTKITFTQNEVALSYHRVRGLYFLAVIFAATILCSGTEGYTVTNKTINSISCSYHKFVALTNKFICVKSL